MAEEEKTNPSTTLTLVPPAEEGVETSDLEQGNVDTGLVAWGKGETRAIETIRVRTGTGLTLSIPATIMGNKARMKVAFHHTLKLIQDAKVKLHKKMKDDEEFFLRPKDILDLASAEKACADGLRDAYEDIPVPGGNGRQAPPRYGLPSVMRLVNKRIAEKPDGSVVTDVVERTLQGALESMEHPDRPSEYKQP